MVSDTTGLYSSASSQLFTEFNGDFTWTTDNSSLTDNCDKGVRAEPPLQFQITVNRE